MNQFERAGVRELFAAVFVRAVLWPLARPEMLEDIRRTIEPKLKTRAGACLHTRKARRIGKNAVPRRAWSRAENGRTGSRAENVPPCPDGNMI